MRKAYFATTLFVLMAAGCAQKVTPDFTYASTSLGFRNSGLLEAGTLYFWDREENTLSRLRPVARPERIPSNDPSNLSASSISGVNFSSSVEIPPAASVEFSAKINGNVSFQADDAIRYSSDRIHSALTDSYRSIFDLGRDGYVEWRIDEHRKDRERYKYVVLVDPVDARGATIKVDNSQEYSATVTAPSVTGSNREFKGKLTIPGVAKASCEAVSDARAPCFISADVYNFVIQPNGNLGYVSANFSPDKLREALRKLISSSNPSP